MPQWRWYLDGVANVNRSPPERERRMECPLNPDEVL